MHVVGAEALASALELKGLVLVVFTAKWCAPCRALKPRLKKAAEQHAGMTVALVDVDAAANVGLSMKYNVKVVPTLLFFRKGRLLERLNEAPTAEALAARVVL